jgi:hypothetical protein
MLELSAETREEAATNISSEQRAALVETLNDMKQNLLAVEECIGKSGLSSTNVLAGEVENV